MLIFGCPTLHCRQYWKGLCRQKQDSSSLSLLTLLRQKCTIPQIVSDAMVLRHVGDKTGEEVFISKFDMAFFFDQFVLAIQERWKNFRFLRVVSELVQHSSLPKRGWHGMHQAHQRLGFGGRRNSKSLSDSLTSLCGLSICT